MTTWSNDSAYIEARRYDDSLIEGDPDSFSFAISEIVTRSTTIPLATPGVTLVVGPNNSGKSTLLREVHELLTRDVWSDTIQNPLLVSDLTIDQGGTPSDAFSWLIENIPRGTDSDGTSMALLSPSEFWKSDDPYQHRIDIGTIVQHLSNRPEGSKSFGRVANLLVFYASTETRLQLSLPALTRQEAHDGAIHPVHAIADDKSILAKAAKLAKSAFGEGLVLDDYSGHQRIRIGEIPIQAPRRDEPDQEYREALLALPELAVQGDGMRSFMGLILPLLTAPFSTVLVDEPEAFLHPPQASALGRALGDIAQTKNMQIIAATHDRNLLFGVLESQVPLTIVRVDRFQDETRKHIHQIHHEDILTISGEPVLRFSNVLDGLFCRLVVLVEGDSDARFFAAALDSLNHASESPLLPLSEVLFVPCGGKGGMSKVARSLTKLGVLVVASPDLDVLKDAGELRGIIEALGGTWSHEIADDYGVVATGVARRSDPPTKAILQGILNASPGNSDHDPVDSGTLKELKRAIQNKDTGWTAVQNAGIKALSTNAETGQAVVRLLDSLEKTRLVALREGELESFALDLGVAKGPGWTPAALQAGVHEKQEVAAHIRRILHAAGILDDKSG